MDQPIFLLGAGFNVDASAAAGRSTPQRNYPLVSDLARECFGRQALPAGTSIEDLFQTAIANRDRRPLERLYARLMEADYYITPELAPKPQRHNVYTQFLNRFAGSDFLTFNYDSLVEILLLRLNRWRPEDGYGIPVSVRLAPIRNTVDLPSRSDSVVIHLHGTLCVYAVEMDFEHRPDSSVLWMTEAEQPRFVFDPDTIGQCFFPYQRRPPELLYKRVEERVIAPVPDKTEGLRGEFVRRMYAEAERLIKQSDMLIAIGYRFGEYDLDSYQSLLVAASRAAVPIHVVSPDAISVVARLRAEPSIDATAEPFTFCEWVTTGFPLTI